MRERHNKAARPTPKSGAADLNVMLKPLLEFDLKIISLIIIFTSNFSVISAHADGDFKLVQSNDAKMNTAFKKARSTLNNFLKLVDKGKDKNSIYGAYVKIEDDGKTEYLWVTDVQKYNEKFYIGYVISTPRLVKNVKKGATIGYKAVDIFDWQHYDKNKKITYGAFTTCALLNPESQEDKENIKRNGLQCSPQ